MALIFPGYAPPRRLQQRIETLVYSAKAVSLSIRCYIHCHESSARLATAWRLRVARPFKAGLPVRGFMEIK